MQIKCFVCQIGKVDLGWFQINLAGCFVNLGKLRPIFTSFDGQIEQNWPRLFPIDRACEESVQFFPKIPLLHTWGGLDWRQASNFHANRPGESHAKYNSKTYLVVHYSQNDLKTANLYCGKYYIKFSRKLVKRNFCD